MGCGCRELYQRERERERESFTRKNENQKWVSVLPERERELHQKRKNENQKWVPRERERERALSEREKVRKKMGSHENGFPERESESFVRKLRKLYKKIENARLIM